MSIIKDNMHVFLYPEQVLQKIYYYVLVETTTVLN